MWGAPEEYAGVGLFDMPDAGGFGAVFGAGEWAEVPEPSLSGGIGGVGVRRRVVEVEVVAGSAAEREHRGGMSGSDGITEGLRDFVGVDGGQVRWVEDGPQTDVAVVAAEEVEELGEQHGSAVFGADDAVAGEQGLVGEVDLEFDSGWDGFQALGGEVVD